jgi:hypothetical protein
MPATDTIDFEREFKELVRELRALPTAAPERVRERVRALGEPAERRRLPVVPWRRAVLVLAPACVLALVAAAVIHGVLNSSPKREVTLAPQRERAATTGAGGARGAPSDQSAAGKSVYGPVTGTKLSGGASPFPSLPTPSPGRYQDYEAWLTVRVKDVDALHERTAEAARLARSYGGYVASVDESTGGRAGQSDLVLRIPVARVEDAYFRFAHLGTVTEQHLSIRDLDRIVRQQRARILQLKLFIARATEELKGSLPADVRIRLQLQLQEARQNLASATGANKATLRQAALSRISLTLTTQGSAPTKHGGAGRIERAARDAGSFLAGAGAVVLFLLIVLSPLIVLGAASVWGARAYRRREERRLLAEA